MNAHQFPTTSENGRRVYVPRTATALLATFLATLTILFGCAFGTAWGGQVSLAWDPNPEPDLTGYRVYYGTAPGSYTSSLDVGNTTTATIPNLAIGTTYYFAVAAYNSIMAESPYSNEVSRTVGGNLPPTITAISDQTIGEDGITGALAFTVGDAETAAGSLTVSGSSGNTALVANGNIVFGGTGASRTVTVTPAANQSGTATITVSVTDGSATTSEVFQLTVNAVNDAPAISDIANQTTAANTPTQAIAFTVGDLETAAGSLSVSGTSSDTALVPNANITFGGSGANRTVTLTPAANQSGTTTISVSTSDGSLSATDTFTLTVTPANTPPTITDISNQVVSEDTPTGPVAFTVNDGQTPPDSLAVNGSSSNAALVPSGNIVFGGSGANRNVKVTPVANKSGTAMITVSVSDGTASTADSFQLTVNAVNDAPTISNIVDQMTRVNTPTAAISFTVGDAETAAGSLTVTGASSNPALVPSGGITFGGSGANRTVTITPAAGQIGTANITVSVSDGTMSASDSFVLTVSNQPAGLVAAYGFNEGTGTTAGDLSGGGITGIINGASWTTDGKFGGALSFNGSTSFVDLGNPAALQLTGSMTWSAWVKAAADPADDGQIVAKSDNSTGWQFKTSPDTGSHTFGVAVSGAAGSRTQRYSSVSRSLDVWYHVTGVFDAAARKLDVYVNGVLSNGSLVGTIPAAQVDSGGNLYIGRRAEGLYFNGIIDEVRIYNRALSASEVQSDMNTPVASPGSNTAPTISTVAGQTIGEDGATGALAITVSDAETAVGSLTMTANSSNTALVPASNVVFGGSGANRTVTVTPAADQSGTATISLTVNDGNLTASSSFQLTVNSVNDAPTISNIADQGTMQNTATGALSFSVGDVESAAGSLTVSGSSSNLTLVPNGNIAFGGSGANRTVTVTPATGQSGTATITVSVSDGALSSSDTFLLTVTGPNVPPTVTLTSPASGSTFTAPASITMTANASDSDGTVARVEFFRGSTKLGQDTSAPYSFTWNNVPTGSYTLKAVAYDNLGASTTSSVVSIRVKRGAKTVISSAGEPGAAQASVAVVLTASYTELIAPARLDLNATVNLQGVSVQRVEFFVGTRKLGADTTAPYDLTWGIIPAGTYDLKAVAVDSDGTTISSGTITVTVGTGTVSGPPGMPLPTISDFTRLADGTTQFNVAGEEGQEVDVWVSNDFRYWTLLISRENLTGTFGVTDAEGALEQQRFYRLSLTY